MTEKTALFGGTFDPIHFGHLRSAAHVLDHLGFDRVIFIPSANPPHKRNQPITDADHRLEMVRLAICHEPRFACDDCEIHRGGPSYTIDTVTAIRDRLGPAVRLAWIIGADSLAELSSWYRVSELVDLCEIITVARPGWQRPDLGPLQGLLSDEQIDRLISSVLDSPLTDISATEIRRCLAAGESIDDLTPACVVEYIEQESIYT